MLRERYQLTIGKNGLIMTSNGREQPYTCLDLGPLEALQLLQELYNRRDLLLAGVRPAFDFAALTIPCPTCKQKVGVAPNGLRWQGYCSACGGFSLDATGKPIPLPHETVEDESD